MKKVLFAAFAGLCIASSFIGTTASKVRVRENIALNALDTVPKPDSPKYAMIMDTVPKKDSSKYASIARYVMDTVPKKDSSKLVDYVAMK